MVEGAIAVWGSVAPASRLLALRASVRVTPLPSRRGVDVEDEPVDDAVVVRVRTRNGDLVEVTFGRDDQGDVGITYCAIEHGRISAPELLAWLDEGDGEISRSGPLSLGRDAGGPWIGIYPEIRRATVRPADRRRLRRLAPPADSAVS
ncbi:hypothetical protein KIH74_22020 [Kineosporia sp. J2-2]|uniref:Uncharacterized protein n=1 Tax=Kineosporia corallincola TaxID=2835133 RepID=A0ABS5TKK3_9ACTN|nr:hypothetical protein [Kineosporia corallincola]MBT0771632.1 hypothetical protein [Kineosporia corallincola]